MAMNGKFNSSVSIRHELHPGDVGYITYLHGLIYGREQGWDHTFDAYVAVPLSEFSKSHTARERIWIAEMEGKIVGSAAVVESSEIEAQLRWLLLDPDVRGMGLGRLMFEEAVEFCRSAGYSSVFLWTVSTLNAAINLYRSVGFEKVDETTHEIRGRTVTEVKYQMSFKAA